MGRAGGHDRRAGGFVRLPNDSLKAVEEAQAEIRRRMLKALGARTPAGNGWCRLREMLQNLQA